MNKYVKGWLLWMAAVLAVIAITFDKAEAATAVGYRVTTFQKGMLEVLRSNADWQLCGEYFAEMEMEDSKVVYFSYGNRPPNNHVTKFTLTLNDDISVSLNEAAAEPVVAVEENLFFRKFYIVLNFADFKAALPCLGRGIKV